MSRITIPLACQVSLATLAITAGVAAGQSDPANFATVINVPPDTAPASIGSDTQLNLAAGGRLPFNFTIGPPTGGSNFEVNVFGGDANGNWQINPGGTVNVAGGTAGTAVISGSVLNLSGGFLGRFTALEGSEINVSGGRVAQGWRAEEGSVVNLADGELGQNALALAGSEVNVHGGSIGVRFDVEAGSRATFTGGSVGSEFAALAGSDVRLVGGDFELNGSALSAGSVVSLTGRDLLTGTLEDGSPFIFTPAVGDQLNDVQLIGASLPPVDVAPMTVSSASPLGGLRAGQTLTLGTGGILRDDFAVVGATLNVAGGRLGNRLEVADSVVNVSSGGNGNGFDRTEFVFAHSGSVVNVTDGSLLGDPIVSRLMVFDGAVANVDGGSVINATVRDGGEINVTNGFSSVQVDVGGRLNVFGGTVRIDRQNTPAGVVNIHGGTVTDRIDLSLSDTGEVNISGGVVEGGVQMGSGSEVTMTGGRLSDLTNASGGNLSVSGGFVVEGLTSWGPTQITGGSTGGRVDLRGGAVELVGGEFALNGQPLPGGTQVTLSGADVLTGTLEDGSVFIYTPSDEDRVEQVTLQSGSLPSLDPSPILVTDASGPRGLRPGQTITVAPGGELPDGFGVVDGTLNVDAGVVGEALEVTRGVVNIGGGEVGGRLDVLEGGIANIDGGSVGAGAKVGAGGQASISGNATISDFNVRLGGRLEVSEEAVAGSVIVDGGELNVSGGSIRTLRSRGAGSVNVAGGEVGALAQLEEGSVLNLSGGRVGFRLGASSGSEVHVTGGSIADDFTAGPGVVVTISGGAVGDSFRTGSQLTVSGGVIGAGFNAGQQSQVAISGGRFGRGFSTSASSLVDFRGGEFRLNGDAVGSGTVTITETDVLSGTLEDGSVFIFSQQAGDTLVGVNLIETTTPAYDTTPIVVADAIAPAFLRAGQTLTLEDGAESPEGFAAVLAEVNVAGGAIARRSEVTESVVRVSGGSIGEEFHAALTSEVTITGGVIGPRFRAYSGASVVVQGGVVDEGFIASAGAEVRVSGGVIGEGFTALAESEVSLSGGQIGPSFLADSGSRLVVTGGVLGDFARVQSSEALIAGGLVGEWFLADEGAEVTIVGGVVGAHVGVSSGGELNVYGGIISDGFFAAAGSEINLYGSSFQLDGAPIEGLIPGQTVLIDQRDVSLAGVLADGSAIVTDLPSRGISVSAFATLTLTLVTELPGDYNNDGVVGPEDYVVWRDHVGDPAGVLLNDPTGLAIGPSQYSLWANNYGATLGAMLVLPEPTSVSAASVLLLSLLGRRRPGLKACTPGARRRA